MSTKVIFIELPVPRKNKYICDITERVYAEEKTVEIFMSEKSAALQLSNELWSWKPDSFVPHEAYFGGDQEPDFSEAPVLITTKLIMYPADVLILHDPLEPEKLKKFSIIIDFAETYEKQRHLASRERYKAFRMAPGFEVSFSKIGTFLGQKKILSF